MMVASYYSCVVAVVMKGGSCDMGMMMKVLLASICSESV